jgi:hypothetical protein
MTQDGKAIGMQHGLSGAGQDNGLYPAGIQLADKRDHAPGGQSARFMAKVGEIAEAAAVVARGGRGNLRVKRPD